MTDRIINVGEEDMADKTWIGEKGDWSNAENWEPAGVPAEGDQVVIALGEASIAAGETIPTDLQITLGSVRFDEPASIRASGTTFASKVTIVVSAAAPYATLWLADGVTFDGAIEAARAQLAVNAAPGFGGAGSTRIAKGATVSFKGAVPATHTIAFDDANGTLVLSDPSEFAATISRFFPGDRIQFLKPTVAESASYAGNTLTILGQGGPLIATITLFAAVQPLAFYATPFGNVGSILTTSRERRLWAGGDGDWYDAQSWTNGPPKGGDSVSIASGTVRITANDFNVHGVLDAVFITLGAAGSNAQVSLDTTDAALGLATSITTRGTPQYAPAYAPPEVTWLARGTTRFNATIFHEAHGGKFKIVVATGASPGEFIIGGYRPSAAPEKDPYATIFVGQESRLDFTGGTVTNGGFILVDGDAEFGQDVTVGGGGTVEIEGGGSVSVLGSVLPAQIFVFGDGSGTLSLGDVTAFQGKIQVAAAGDRIVLPNLPVASLAYGSGQLVLKDSDGPQIAALSVTDPNGRGVADFALASKGDGSEITYAPKGAVTLQLGLPVAAVGTAGSLIPLQTLLRRAFGTIPSGYPTYTLSRPSQLMPPESYWGQIPNGVPVNSAWCVDNEPISESQTVDKSELDRVALYVGNNIVPTAHFIVPVAFAEGDPNKATESIKYSIWTADPRVSAPQTAWSEADPNVPGSASRFGRLDPTDIVSSAYRYNTVFPGVFNHNNCNWISDNVTAGAGAVQPYENYSPDPTNNVSGGFWRIVYRGTDTPDPVRDWFQLTVPGDVVRMGRLDATGHHTTTVIGTLNPDATITVYDNGDHNAAGQNIIGVHQPTYWTGTNPGMITIYRLDPNHQYLIEGTGESEFIQGTVFDNLIRPGGGRDTIAAGPRTNEIQGTLEELDGTTVLNFYDGDLLDFTDLATAGATVAFSSGVLTVSDRGSVAARVRLPDLPTDASFSLKPDGRGGCSVSLIAVPAPARAVAAQPARGGCS
jgi:hypothetical protein